MGPAFPGCGLFLWPDRLVSSRTIAREQLVQNQGLSIRLIQGHFLGGNFVVPFFQILMTIPFFLFQASAISFKGKTSVSMKILPAAAY